VIAEMVVQAVVDTAAASVVVDIVAASVAEMDMGSAGGCLGVRVRLACRSSILALPFLVTCRGDLGRPDTLEEKDMSDSICSICYERWSNIAKDSNITRPWLDKYQERVQLSPVHR
jgi:hypothetical protein